MGFSVAEARFLAAHAGEIADVAPEVALTKQSVFADRAVLDARFGEYARAVSVLISSQRAAAGKFPEDWLTDADAVQQATPARVACVRAGRIAAAGVCLLYTSPSPRDRQKSRMPSSA